MTSFKSRPRTRRKRPARAPTLEPGWDEAYARRLKKACGAHSIAEIVQRTGLNRETVRRHYRGTRPSVAFVVQFCRAYGVTADWLLGVWPQVRARRKH